MLVSVEDLQSYMNGMSLTYDQDANAALVLSGVQAKLEMYLRRVFEPTQIREMARSNIQGVLIVDYAPVVKVIKVTPLLARGTGLYNYGIEYIATPMERDAYLRPGSRMIDTVPVNPNATNVIVPGGIYVGVPDSPFVVEYVSHYMGPHIEAVKDAIKVVAARRLSTSVDNTISLSQDAPSRAAQQDPRGSEWTPDELAQFDRLKRRTIL